MAAATAYPFTVVHLPHDEKSLRKYLEPYKTLRLLALKTNPEAFHSTYAREVTFSEDIWHDRLANPAANTFVAFNMSALMIGMTTVVGPLDHGPHELPVLGVPISCLTDKEIQEGIRPLHYRLNAVFTHPEARRKGVAQAVIQSCIRCCTDQVPLSRKNDLVISVTVELDVPSAKALYEKCGFVETKRILRQEEAYLTNVAILEYAKS